MLLGSMLKATTKLAVVVSAFASFGTKAETLQIDLRNYIYQSPANDMMLCQSDLANCSKGFVSSDDELVVIFTNGVLDYTARSNTSPYFIGVVRYFDPTDPNVKTLRCLSQENQYCTAPPTVAYPVGSAPQIFDVNVASVQDELNADNPDGSPRQAIPGNVSFTNNQQVNFGIVDLDNACNPTYIGTIGHQVLAVFVRQLDFQGDLGPQDTLIIDEYETGPTLETYHMERYYFVNGYGRVRDGASYYDPNTMVYDGHLSGSSIRNTLRPSTLAPPANTCPQGSAPLQ